MTKKENEIVSTEIEKTVETAEAKFSLDSFAEHCFELFGISISTFAGATAKLDPDGEFTKSEIKKTIKKWMETEVK